jgi:2'-5' RNA ligase
MNRVKLARKLLKSTVQALKLKVRADAPARNKAICRAVHLKQVSEVEQSLASTLKPFFEQQLKDVAERLMLLATPAFEKSWAEKNCGTGDGGFKPGNQCARGGGEKKIKIELDDDVDEHELKMAFGGASLESLAKSAGAIPGSKATFSFFDNRDLFTTYVDIHIEHPEYTASRTLNSSGGIHNEEIFAKNTGTGLGTRVFHEQVQAASAAGFKKITCEAIREAGEHGDTNGYYTWPRLGYSGEIPKSLLSKLSTDLPSHASETTVHGLMKTKEGRDWWKEHGESFSATFDLTQSSTSRQVLDEYVKQKSGTKSFSSVKSTDSSRGLAQLVYEPAAWNEALIQAALPPLVKSSVKAALAQWKVMGVNVRKIQKSIKNCGTGAGGFKPGNQCSKGGGGRLEFGGNTAEHGEGVVETTQKWFGRNLTDDEWSGLAGAPSGSEVKTTLYTKYDKPHLIAIECHNKEHGIKSTQTIALDGDGKGFRMGLVGIDITKPGNGTGTQVFNHQVKTAEKLDVISISLLAEGPPKNGHYTWPRLGCDGRLPWNVKLPDTLKHAKDTSDLMKSEEGRKWWKENGNDVQLYFDPKEGSQSRKVLDAYYSERFGTSGEGGKSTGDDGGGRKDLGQDLGRPWKGGPGSGPRKRGTRPVDEGPSKTPRNEAETQLQTYLETVRGFMASNFAGHADFKHKGVEDLVLSEGKYFNPAPRPKDIKKQPDKECFKNAFQVMMDHGHTYVEGYAFPKGIPLPIHHAWNVDKNGKVIDSTWKEPGVAYLGVPLSDNFTLKHASETGVYGVFGGYDAASRNLLQHGLPDGAVPEGMKSFEKNCGIGSGGFQPGNQCAKGGGGRTLESMSEDTLAKVFLVQKQDVDKNSFKSFKASSATEYLSSLDPTDPDNDLPDTIFNTPYGSVGMHFATEMPQWMKQKIKEHIEDTFDQPYWAKINETTLDDIEQYLSTGLQDGWSISTMAEKIAATLGGGDYANWRATNIARTESGNALNGARSLVADGLIGELGDVGKFIKKVWLSVLGSTTRAAHANLDGVPADANNLWNLNGVLCRWPGDTRLPAGDRCHCQCTVVVEFGMDDATARQLVRDYEDRVIASEKAFRIDWFKKIRQYSCLMLEIPEPLSSKITELGQDWIRNEDLAEEGRETWPHITIKYGLHTEDAQEILDHFKRTLPPRFTIGKISKFEGEEADVIKMDVISDDLSWMRAICEQHPHTDRHSVYHPHITLAYVKKGQIVYQGPTELTGKQFIGENLVFSSKNETKTQMRLDGEGTLSKFEKNIKAESGANCGTGAGGFKPGNQCARSGGSRDLEAAKAKYNGHVETYQKLQKEYQEKFSYDKNKARTPDERAAVQVDGMRAYREKEEALYHATTERMAYEAANPEEYRKIRKDFIDKQNAWAAEEEVFAQKLIDQGVRGKDSTDDIRVRKLRAPQDYFETTDEGARNSVKKDYIGLKDEHIDEARKLWERKPDDSMYHDEDMHNAYYGESKTVTLKGTTDGAPVSEMISSKVAQGGGDENAKGFMADGKVAMQVSEKAFVKMISGKSQKVLNRFESGAVDGVGKKNKNYNTVRKEAEKELFGLDDTADPAIRPKYGYIEHPDRLTSQGASMSSNYGKVQIIFGDDVKTRTTYTVGDSLDQAKLLGLPAMAVNNPAGNLVKMKNVSREDGAEPEGTITTGSNTRQWKFKSNDPESTVGYNPSYIEAQIHGELKISDIKEIRVPRYTEIPETIKKKLVKLNVSVIEVPPAHVITSAKPWDDVFKDED